MKLLISIIWLGGGIVWTISATQGKALSWVFVTLSFIFSIAYAISYGKQLKK